MERPQRRQIMRNGTVCRGAWRALTWRFRHTSTPCHLCHLCHLLLRLLGHLRHLRQHLRQHLRHLLRHLLLVWCLARNAWCSQFPKALSCQPTGWPGWLQTNSGPLQLEIRAVREHAKYPRKCAASAVLTDATTCFSSRWPWQRPLTPGRSLHPKTLKSLRITVLKAVYGSRLWTIWVWCFQSEMWSPMTSGVDSASLTLGVEFYTIVIYYDFVQSRLILPFHTVSLHSPFEFEGQLGYVFCRR